MIEVLTCYQQFSAAIVILRGELRYAHISRSLSGIWYSPRLLRRVATYMCGRGFAPRISKLPSNARRAFLRPANRRPLNGLTPSGIIGVALPVTIASTLFRHRTFFV